MRGRDFTQEERRLLEANSSVLKVVNSNIIYTEEFKQLAIMRHKDGISARLIFIEAGIDLSIFPDNYARYAIKRWKSQSNLQASQRKRGGGRPKKSSNMTQSELEARVAYLEAENDFLKKLRALEKGG